MTTGEGGATTDAQGESTSWIEGIFEVEESSPPVGSVAAGAFGIGFDLIEPGQGVTKSFDAAGNEVEHSLVSGLPRYDKVAQAVTGGAYAALGPSVAPEALDPFLGTPAPEDGLWTVEGQPEGQEEALESTALPGRVEIDASMLGVDPNLLG